MTCTHVEHDTRNGLFRGRLAPNGRSLEWEDCTEATRREHVAEGHKPIFQSCSVGRFVVCSCSWRWGYGNSGEVRAEHDRHVRSQG